MPYVRKRGSHLAIVHGARHPTTKKVEQQILLTIHSKAEALAVLGRTGKGEDGRRLRALLAGRYPTVRFDWKEVERGLDAMKDELPDIAPARDARAFRDFRENLAGFARQLAIADPQSLASARALLTENREELSWLAELIRWRVELLDRIEDNKWTEDPFGWRLALGSQDVPPETEEMAADLYEKGNIDRAEKVFGLLTDAFPSYAEGWNYLGLIALRRGEVPMAIERFEKTIRIGRTLFPRKTAKSTFWHSLETRPYMRGLANLTVALNRAGRYDEALAVADRLEHECGAADGTWGHRTMIFLNRGEWQRATEAASGRGDHPGAALMSALAAFELGRLDLARFAFVRACLGGPRAVAIVLGIRSTAPGTYFETEDHNAGVELRASLAGYLGSRSARSTRFTRDLWRAAALQAALAEIAALERQDPRADASSKRASRLQHLRSETFARQLAAELASGKLATHSGQA